MAKKKIQLTDGIDVNGILKDMADLYKDQNQNHIDGLKVEFASSWVHLRKSNTEPIIRIYTEAQSISEANDLADKVMQEIKALSDKS